MLLRRARLAYKAAWVVSQATGHEWMAKGDDDAVRFAIDVLDDIASLRSGSVGCVVCGATDLPITGHHCEERK